VLAAWGAIALLVAVYPANIHMALADVPIGDPPHSAGVFRWIRLPLQFLLMAWAWWHTRPDRIRELGEHRLDQARPGSASARENAATNSSAVSRAIRARPMPRASETQSSTG
jgi:hypothetical protein